MLIISGGGGNYGINGWVCFHHMTITQIIKYDKHVLVLYTQISIPPNPTSIHKFNYFFTHINVKYLGSGLDLILINIRQCIDIDLEPL